jgi:hypothetical protein
MGKPKEKLSPEAIRRRSFVMFWSISFTCLWLVVWGFLKFNAFRVPSIQVPGYLGIFIIAGLIALMQRRLLQRPMSGWVPVTVFGTMLSFAAFQGALGIFDRSMILPSLALLVPTSLVQMLWLWRHVKSAWLWPLAHIVAVLFFAPILRDYGDLRNLGFGFIGLGILQGVAQAYVMRHLWSHPREAGSATQRTSPEMLPQETLERLSVNETPDEIINETPLAQRLTR